MAALTHDKYLTRREECFKTRVAKKAQKRDVWSRRFNGKWKRKNVCQGQQATVDIDIKKEESNLYIYFLPQRVFADLLRLNPT